MKKTAMILAAALALTGCGTTYTYDGQTYNGEESFLSAVDQKVAEGVASIQPLGKPLTQKSLVAYLPETAILEQVNLGVFKKNNGGRDPVATQPRIINRLSESTMRHARGLIKAVDRRGIYKDVTIVDQTDVSAEPQPSANNDILLVKIADTGAGQWYYISSKSGKQLFAFDQTGKDYNEGVKNFIQAAEAMALREK